MNLQEWEAHCRQVAVENDRALKLAKRPKRGPGRKKLREGWEAIYATMGEACDRFDTLPLQVQEAMNAHAANGWGDELGERLQRAEQIRLWDSLLLKYNARLYDLAYQRVRVGDYSLTGLPQFRLPSGHAAQRRCRAKNRRGGECRCQSVPGRKRCRFHGGYTPPKSYALVEVSDEIEGRLEANPHDLEALALLSVLLRINEPVTAPWERDKEMRLRIRRQYRATAEAATV